jgi:alpha-tubulin suppressor-like RCC1 family protein
MTDINDKFRLFDKQRRAKKYFFLRSPEQFLFHKIDCVCPEDELTGSFYVDNTCPIYVDSVDSLILPGIFSIGGGCSICPPDVTFLHEEPITDEYETLSAGNTHVLRIRADGSLWAWGSNSDGQLALPYVTLGRNEPTRIGEDDDWVHVAAGELSSFAIKRDGSLWAWGSNTSGRLGIGNIATKTNVPTQVGSDYDWKYATAGQLHSLAIKKDGTLWAWGSNLNGRTGLNTTSGVTWTPQKVGNDSDWSKISAGLSHNLAIKNNNTLWTWGDNSYGKTGIGEFFGIVVEPVQVGNAASWHMAAAGFYHSLAIMVDGTMWSWGMNTNGQLGLGDSISRNQPHQVGTFSNWSFCATGIFHSIGIRGCGCLRAWGFNEHGQLGTGDTEDRDEPFEVGEECGWIKVAVGGIFNIGFQGSFGVGGGGGGGGGGGSSKFWGNNINGIWPDAPQAVLSPTIRSGSESLPSEYVLPLTGIRYIQLAVGDHHSLALRSDGVIDSWGRNNNGQLGRNGKNNRACISNVGDDNDWQFVEAGRRSSFAIKVNGTLWSWGNNEFGQLGYTNAGDIINPTLVNEDEDWISVSTSGRHTLAIKEDGTVWSWGLNSSGQLGLGNYVNQDTPIELGLIGNEKAIMVFANGHHSFALLENYTVFSWGNNQFGQLGLGDIDEFTVTVPTQIPFQDWGVLTVGNKHVLGVRFDGSVWVWGDNSLGQLGLSSTVFSNQPVNLPIGMDFWGSIQTNFEQSFSISFDSKLRATGLNDKGQLGLNNINNSINEFTQVGDENNWILIAAGNKHTLGFRSEGILWSWGDNTYGQLGHCDFDARAVPTEILRKSNEPGSMSGWDYVSIDGTHVIGVSLNQKTWTWGHLSSGSEIVVDSNLPINLEELDNPEHVSAGPDRMFVIMSDPEDLNSRYISGSGYNDKGQLGFEESVEFINIFDSIETLGSTWLKISNGVDHSVAIKSDGTLWTWGSNEFAKTSQFDSQDNIITTGSSYGPHQIGSGSNWIDIAAGANHNLAIDSAGYLWGWGDNSYGLTGQSNGNNDPITAGITERPSLIGTASNWTNVWVGHKHNVALNDIGELWCWGDNSYGQLGQESYVDSVTSPVIFSSGSNWISAAAGHHHTLAIDSNNVLWSCGKNGFGQLGLDFTTSAEYDIQQIDSSNNWGKVYAAGDFSAAIDSDNVLYMWGNNEQGQLGLGHYESPVTKPTTFGNLDYLVDDEDEDDLSNLYLMYWNNSPIIPYSGSSVSEVAISTGFSGLENISEFLTDHVIPHRNTTVSDLYVGTDYSSAYIMKWDSDHPTIPHSSGSISDISIGRDFSIDDVMQFESEPVIPYQDTVSDIGLGTNFVLIYGTHVEIETHFTNNLIIESDHEVE